MISRRRALDACLAAAALPFTAAVRAADKYPGKPIRLVAPYAPGTATDLTARVLADGLAKVWGVAIPVDNIVGASGVTGTAVVAKAPADGYTLAMIASNHVINPHLYHNLPFDTLRDFTPICMVAQTQIVLVVNASSDIADVKTLLQKARRSPGRINYGSAGNGSVGQLVMEQIKLATNTFITHIPYRGQNQAMADLLGGRIDVALPALGVAEPFLSGGKLRAIGIVSSTRSSFAPDIPTVQEQIGKPIEGLAWWGLIGPKGVPPEVVETIGSGVRAQLRTPAVMERMRSLRAEIIGSSAREMEQTMRADMERVGKVVAAARIRID
jgi:tripartite-type tricarboxylate transporter receptor subunit TctC